MEEVVNLDVLIDASSNTSLETGLRKVLAHVKPDWRQSDVRCKIFTAGLTNSLVGGWEQPNKDDMVLVRVYGDDTEKFIDRASEKINMKKMENRQIFE